MIYLDLRCETNLRSPISGSRNILNLVDAETNLFRQPLFGRNGMGKAGLDLVRNSKVEGEAGQKPRLPIP